MDSIVLGVAKSQTQSVRLSHKYRASRVALAIRIHLPRLETLETWVRSLGWEDPLEEGTATTPVFLPGESHGHRSLMGYSL